MDIKILDDKELKSIAYDELARIEQAQFNLRCIKDELTLRKVNSEKPKPLETN